MSTELYGSGTAPYYLNHLENDYLADQNIINGNRLNLFPEQSLEIYNRCFNYLATCQLSSRCVRIFCAVMDQTVIFGKLEDNVTSTRLQQLTKIRRDHAASAMRELAKNNVIIHRRGGEFHNYVSINFNLDSWGSGRANNEARSNDPRHLISDQYADEAVDQGLELTATDERISVDEAIDQGLQLSENQPIEITPKSTESNQSKIIINTEKQAIQSASQDIDTEPQTITVAENQAQSTQVDIAGNHSQTAENTEFQVNNIDQNKHLDVEDLALSLQNKLFSAFEELEEKVCTQLRNIEEKVHHSNISTDNNAVCQSVQENNPVIDAAPKISNRTSPDEYDNPPSDQQAKKKISQAEAAELLGDLEIPNRHTIYRAITMDKLNFPTQLTSVQCDNLQEYLLPRAENKAQALLKILAKRLNNTAKPVKNPIAYFSSLVKKLEASTLDLSVVEIEMQVEQLDQKIEAITQIYNEERNDYYHCQKLVEQEMQKSDLDFKEAAKKIQVTEILDYYVDKLEKMRSAGQPLFDARAGL